MFGYICNILFAILDTCYSCLSIDFSVLLSCRMSGPGRGELPPDDEFFDFLAPRTSWDRLPDEGPSDRSRPTVQYYSELDGQHVTWRAPEYAEERDDDHIFPNYVVRALEDERDYLRAEKLDMRVEIRELHERAERAERQADRFRQELVVSDEMLRTARIEIRVLQAQVRAKDKSIQVGYRRSRGVMEALESGFDARESETSVTQRLRLVPPEFVEPLEVPGTSGVLLDNPRVLADWIQQ